MNRFELELVSALSYLKCYLRSWTLVRCVSFVLFYCWEVLPDAFFEFRFD